MKRYPRLRMTSSGSPMWSLLIRSPPLLKFLARHCRIVRVTSPFHTEPPTGTAFARPGRAQLVRRDHALLLCTTRDNVISVTCFAFRALALAGRQVCLCTTTSSSGGVTLDWRLMNVVRRPLRVGPLVANEPFSPYSRVAAFRHSQDLRLRRPG